MRIVFFLFQAEDGIRDLVRSRGLGDVYKRQQDHRAPARNAAAATRKNVQGKKTAQFVQIPGPARCD